MAQTSKIVELPHDQPLLPSLKPSMADLLMLAIAMALVFGALVIRGASDLTLPLGPFSHKATADVASFASPLMREAESPVKRPLAKMIVKSVRGFATFGLAEDAASVAAHREATAIAIQRLNAVALALTIIAAFVWLKLILRQSYSVLPGAMAVLLAVSPWHAGLPASTLITGDLLALFFILLTLTCHSVDPTEHPRAQWGLIFCGWVFGISAILCSEFALPIVLYCLLVDFSIRDTGVSFGKLMVARIGFYLPMILVTFIWLGLLKSEGVSLKPLSLLGGFDSLARMIFHPVDAFDFFHVGRRPHQAGGVLAAILALVVLVALSRLLWLKKDRLSIYWTLAFLVSFLPSGLPQEDGHPFVSYAFLAIPMFFLVLLAANYLAGKLATDPDSTSMRWKPEFQSVLAIVALALMVMTVWRTLPIDNARLFYIKAVRNFDQFPELSFRASELQMRYALQSAPEKNKESAREFADKLLADSLRQYLALREDGFEGKIRIPTRAFQEHANSLIRKKQIAEAIPLLEQAVNIAPSNRGLLYQLSRLYLITGDEAAAKVMFIQALELDPDARDAMRLVRMAMNRKDFQAVVDFLELLLATDKLELADRYRPLLWQGLAYVNLRRPDAALEPLREARAIKGEEDREAANLMIGAHAALGQWDEVKELTSAEDDDSTTGLPKLRDVISGPYSAAVQANDIKTATMLLEKWMEVADPGKERAIALMNRGRFHEATKRPLDALNDFREATEEAPEYPEVWNSLSLYYIRGGFPVEAAEALEQGYKLQPENAAVLDLLVRHYLQQGNRDKAIETLREAIASETTPNADIRFILANVYLQSSLNELAVETLVEALAVMPDNLEIKLRLSDAYAKTDDYEKGAEILVELLIERPSEPILYLRLIELFEENGDLDSAREVVLRGIQNCPRGKSVDLFLKGADIALKGKNLDIARKSFLRALDIDPDNESAQKGLEEIDELQRRQKAQLDLLRAAKGIEAPEE